MLTKETLKDMGSIYRELEAGEKFLEEVDKELSKESERIDFHGKAVSTLRNCQLGWPTSDSSWRLYTVEPKLARAVIISHLADQREKLEKLNEIAKLEILGASK